jgi:5-methylcytosine-specific restriction endonuclease McrA
MKPNSQNQGGVAAGSAPKTMTTRVDERITRTSVTPGKPYTEYRDDLRYDFFHSCAYCTIAEAEAQAIRFTIDHYEPQKARPDLVNEYANLMYSCDECNRRKGDRCPPPVARASGNRFFRPDEDVYGEHFEKQNALLTHKSEVGNFTIAALDLNRLGLRRLRELRVRLKQCDAQVLGGILALRKFPIDQLPINIKGRAAIAIRRATSIHDQITINIDRLLRENAKSPLIDRDPGAQARATERTATLKHLEALFPGNWRAPRG